MSQTLIVHHDKSLVELLNLNLPLYVGTDIVVKDSFKNAVVLLENHPGIHLIIAAGHIGSETTAESIYKLKPDVPLIVLGKGGKLVESATLTLLPGTPELKPIIQAAAKHLKVTPKKMMEQVVPDYFPIQTSFFMHVGLAPSNIYVQDNDGNYTLLFAAESLVDLNVVRRLNEEGNKHLYVDAVHRLKLVNHVSVKLQARLQDSSTDPELRMAATDDAIHLVREEAIKGPNPLPVSTQELTDITINACIDIAKSSPRIASLIKRLLSNRSSYLYKHTQLIIHITQHIVSQQEWGTNEQKHKLAYVAFFHDICLTNDRQAKYRSDISVSSDPSLGIMDKDIIFKHAHAAAEIVQKFPQIPLGSDILIMQHHGSISGHGFAKTFSSTLSPLAIIFIVAEELAHRILDREGENDISVHMPEILTELKGKFGRSRYLKIVESLESLAI